MNTLTLTNNFIEKYDLHPVKKGIINLWFLNLNKKTKKRLRNIAIKKLYFYSKYEGVKLKYAIEGEIKYSRNHKTEYYILKLVIYKEKGFGVIDVVHYQNLKRIETRGNFKNYIPQKVFKFLNAPENVKNNAKFIYMDFINKINLAIKLRDGFNCP